VRAAARGRARVLHEYTGIGSETYRRRGMVDMPGPEAATVRVEADGGRDLPRVVSVARPGARHHDTRRLVADQLGVPLEAVTVRQPDTDEAPPGTGTFASRGAIAQSGAADAAAATVRGRAC